MDKVKVGLNIKIARQKQKMKQKELANKIGYSESSISKYEQGLIDIPNTVIERIAKELKISPIELLNINDWEEKYNKGRVLANEVELIEQIESIYGEDTVELIRYFTQLNDIGRKKALNDMGDLTEIPKYQK